MGKKIKFRLSALADQEPVSPTIEKTQRDFVSHIQSLMLLLDSSPTGRVLLQMAVAHNVSVGLDPLLEPSSIFFYPAQNHFDFGYQPDILQKTEKGQGRYLVSLIGGLRRAWHHLLGHSADVSLKLEDFLLHFRCEEADIVSMTHLIGWELRAAGHSFLWRHLLSGPNGDMAVIFERAVSENPYAQFDGRALKETFNQWFAEATRTGACDRLGLEIMDMALLQQGRAGNIGIRNARQENMQRVGTLPNGKTYLSGCLFMGGWYNALDDNFNRTHLKYIKQDILQLIENKENI